MTDNTSTATYSGNNSWKSPSGTEFGTPDSKPPVYGTPITIHDGKGGCVLGRWLNNEAVKDS